MTKTKTAWRDRPENKKRMLQYRKDNFTKHYIELKKLDPLNEKLIADAQASGVGVARIIRDILERHYDIR